MRALRIPALVLAGALAGCGATPVDYHSQAEIPQGPGLLSGKEGAFVFRVGKAAEPAENRDAFEQWKCSTEGSAEYREFQDWREWREWKRRNAQ